MRPRANVKVTMSLGTILGMDCKSPTLCNHLMGLLLLESVFTKREAIPNFFTKREAKLFL